MKYIRLSLVAFIGLLLIAALLSDAGIPVPFCGSECTAPSRSSLGSWPALLGLFVACGMGYAAWVENRRIYLLLACAGAAAALVAALILFREGVVCRLCASAQVGFLLSPLSATRKMWGGMSSLSLQAGVCLLLVVGPPRPTGEVGRMDWEPRPYESAVDRTVSNYVV